MSKLERYAGSRMNRRMFFLTAASVAGGWYVVTQERTLQAEAHVSGSAAKEVTIVEFGENGKRMGVVHVPKIVKSEEEWKKQLSPRAYLITRKADTEDAFSGKYWNNHDKGLYRCICCNTALFSSDTKFGSGTGWPSFWQPIAKENVWTEPDHSFGLDRIAVSCTRCDAHLGHVFDDGPKPTGLRYCMNSEALSFAKLATS
jgi:peptide-methionine (R)-S-oxide reductase